MTLPAQMTKIVATIGPASQSQEVMVKLIDAGMNVARLNFSHGDFASHGQVIKNLRAAAKVAGRRIAIMADLSGPKMRIGQLAEEPIQLHPGDLFTLTTRDVMGDARRVSVSFENLPQAVKPGDTLYLNDGYIELIVIETRGTEVMCKVWVGGELRSRKGLNLPDIELGVSAFTPRDRECLAFALAAGVDGEQAAFLANVAAGVVVGKAGTATCSPGELLAAMDEARE